MKSLPALLVRSRILMQGMPDPGRRLCVDVCGRQQCGRHREVSGDLMFVDSRSFSYKGHA
jgi:hypothetical protein